MYLCSQCNSSSFDTNQQQEKCCTNCGWVQEQNNLVSDVEIIQNKLQGQIINQAPIYQGGLNYSDYIHQKASKLINQIAANLNIPQFDVEPALQAYMYAQHRNFIKGRHSAHVAAACLYIVCRERNKPHLLIDFSDSLHINLYTLGACFLKLVKFLHKDLPLIDPCVFIRRFCSSLEFGEQQNQVEVTANRLLKRMRQDWIEQGRRPSSLCGAAILIAARYHGFKRSTGQIVKIVNVCDETLRKRLEEFKQTSVAKLTREEFARLDQEIILEEELYPPSFKKAIKNKQFLSIKQCSEKLDKKAQKIEEQLKSVESLSEISRSRMNSFFSSGSRNSSPIKDHIQKQENYQPLQQEIDNESISDIEDQDVNQYILSSEETRIKTLIWNNIHKDWINEQSQKQLIVSKKQIGSYQRKKCQKNNLIIDAPNAISALINDSKISSKLNQNIIIDLFNPDIQIDKEPQIVKKIQLDCL